MGLSIDREKVIKGLEHCSEDGCKDCPYETDCTMCDGFSLLAKDALTLLKEQEAVEPKLVVDALVCGNCGHDLIHQEMLGDNVLFEERHNYCPQCWKKVKWE